MFADVAQYQKAFWKCSLPCKDVSGFGDAYVRLCGRFTSPIIIITMVCYCPFVVSSRQPAVDNILLSELLQGLAETMWKGRFRKIGYFRERPMSMFLRSHSRSGCTNERGALFTCDAPADLSPVQVPAARSPFSLESCLCAF